MLTVFLQKFAVILFLYQTVSEGRDFLHLFRPKPDLPQELNDFLTDVQHHKKDFAFIRNVAKNRRNYEKSYEENHRMFVEDLENQMTINPNYNKRNDEYGIQQPQINELKHQSSQEDWLPEYNSPNNLLAHYPEGRYSKFIHSPVRLRRELEENYLNQRVKVNRNGEFGNIIRNEEKYPGSKFRDDQNRYHTGHIVSLEDDIGEDDEDYYQPAQKKKREVEISIKSDGKLVRRIQENEEIPKSIILNIKSSNSNPKMQGEEPPSTPAAAEELGASLGQPNQEIDDLNNGPSNSKTIPNIRDSNADQNSAQNKKIGVPINSLINGELNSGKQTGAGPETSNDSPLKLSYPGNTKVTSNNQPYNVEVSNKFNAGEYKPLNRPVIGQENIRWPGEDNHFAKNMEVSQYNMNNLGNFDRKQSVLDLEHNSKDNKKDEFEKVQGLVVDNIDVDPNNKKPNGKYLKRHSDRKQRLNVASKERITDENTHGQPVEDSEPIDESIQGSNEIVMSKNEIHLISDAEKGTENVLLIPFDAEKSDYIKQEESAEQRERAAVMGQAIAEGIIEPGENEESTFENDVTSEISMSNQQKLTDNRIENYEYGMHGEENKAKIDQAHEKSKKRSIRSSRYDKSDKGKAKKTKPKATVTNKEKKGKGKKNKKTRRQPQELSAVHSKRQQEGDEDALRDRKHLPTLPKYKRKRVRQHPKKRVNRNTDDTSLVDLYDLNEFYDGPEDEFDFIPSYRQRQLKSVEYEFDPELIQDVGNYEKKEIEKFEKSAETHNMKNNVAEHQSKQGLRKKLKSEGDYSEEEDPMTSSPVKNVPIKKTQNQFAMDHDATTESNDDDYDYSDFDDMEDGDEDITYEEEVAKEDDLAIEEPVGSKNKNEHSDDRIYSNVPTTVLNIKLEYSEPTSQKTAEGPTVIQNFGLEKIDKVLLEANELLASAHAHGRGAPKTKTKKKKPPKRESNTGDESNRRALQRVNRTRRRRRKKRVKSSLNKNDFDSNGNGNILTDEVISSFHGRGPHAVKQMKHKYSKPKRQSESNGESKQNLEDQLKFQKTDEKLSGQFEDKPLSNQQKEDLFLRYNPEFQRWPRFVQSDNKYHELMRRRALENQRRYFRNSADNFPISNEYFLNPRAEFVKREEPATASTSKETAATGASSEISKEASEGHIEGASQASAGASEAAASVGIAVSEGSPGVGEASATLPQSAEKILQTANSDIFENTTAFGMGGLDPANAFGALGGNAASASTRFEFTTNSGDLTEDTKCVQSTHKVDLISPCPEESASHSPVTVTSVLPLIKESVTVMKVNISKDEFLDLNEIVVGSLPKHIVSESLSNAKGSVRRGLRSKKFNVNLLLSNHNSSAETNMILSEMTHLMLKLKYHTTCQVLPPNLLIYVKTITKNEMDDPMMKLKEMNDIDFDEHQSNYVFHSGESNKIEDKALVLKELLNKYNNLPEHCKERAEPVKEYIESHLAMIERMSGKTPTKTSSESTVVAEQVTHNANSSIKPKEKKEIRMPNSMVMNEENLENQIMEEGLSNQNPNANEVIENREKKNKREAYYFKEIGTSTSPQYGKLADAVRNMRHKRQVMKRISEIYGKAKREKGGSKSKRRTLFGNEEKGFEAPRVINF